MATEAEDRALRPPPHPGDPIAAFLMVPVFAVPLFIVTHAFILRALFRRAA